MNHYIQLQIRKWVGIQCLWNLLHYQSANISILRNSLASWKTFKGKPKGHLRFINGWLPVSIWVSIVGCSHFRYWVFAETMKHLNTEFLMMYWCSTCLVSVWDFIHKCALVHVIRNQKHNRTFCHCEIVLGKYQDMVWLQPYSYHPQLIFISSMAIISHSSYHLAKNESWLIWTGL